VLIPPAIYDEETLDMLDPNAVKAINPSSGMIQSFTVVYEDRGGHLLAKPEIIVQVCFPGAKGSVIGRLDAKDEDEIYEGAPVVLAKPKKMDGPDAVVFKLK